jgi:hypothetical protein
MDEEEDRNSQTKFPGNKKRKRASCVAVGVALGCWEYCKALLLVSYLVTAFFHMNKKRCNLFDPGGS